ncbi:MAG: RHS repeat-associated core domain-containing protein [Synergistales bacterium]|nr:RHS repeat-associated core domain-containing protein [Synergistales bacterium]
MVASYRYDAWGNILEASGPLAQVNPYRYAGYRWDQSTGLYFLQTRYYNSGTGHFLSGDAVLGTPFASQTLNARAYGANNPVRFVDPDGRWVQAAVGAAVGAAIGLGTYLWDTRGQKRSVGQALVSTAYGAVTGALISTVGGSAVAGAAINVGMALYRGERNPKRLVAEAAKGAAYGTVGLYVTKLVGPAVAKVITRLRK